MQWVALKLKQSLCVCGLSVAVLGFASSSLAITVEEVPNPRQVNGGWVTDMAQVLTPQTEAQLNEIISKLEAENGSEIAVVTVAETAPSATPKEFATSLFNRWKIGKKGQDNGVLLLISKGDRRVEIETGYGVESLLPDAKAGSIIQQEITPKFKENNFDGGTLAGTKAIIVALQTNDPSTTSPNTNVPETAYNADAPSKNDNAGIPGWLLAGIGGIGGIGAIAYALSRRPVYIEPKGRSQSDSWFPGRFHCANCKQPLQHLKSDLLLPYLSKGEQVAQNIGSIQFEAWQCPTCSKTLSEPAFHIRADINNLGEFSNCPNCQEYTVIRNEKTLRHATTYSDGIRLITYDCQYCSDHREEEEIIPRLPPPPPPSSGGSSGGGSSSSGGSFGGGSSGGGGAGGSW